MEKVPAAGYRIIGLDMAGNEKHTEKSCFAGENIETTFAGGRWGGQWFQTGHNCWGWGLYKRPLLKVCSWMGVPYVLQEQTVMQA